MFLLFTNLLPNAILIMKVGVNMGEIRENLRRNLCYYLSIKEMTQKELSQKLGVSQSAVTNWIKGKNSPDIEMVAQICDVLNIPVTELFNVRDSQYTELEQRIITQYRKKTELQQAVLLLLDIKNPEE